VDTSALTSTGTAASGVNPLFIQIGGRTLSFGALALGVLGGLLIWAVWDELD